jgi:hypothetical protein
MIADPKRKPHQDNGDSDKHRRQEEALDEAVKNAFPASGRFSAEFDAHVKAEIRTNAALINAAGIKMN